MTRALDLVEAHPLTSGLWTTQVQGSAFLTEVLRAVPKLGTGCMIPRKSAAMIKTGGMMTVKTRNGLH